MDKKDLVPGDFIVTKIAFGNGDDTFHHEAPYMLRDIDGLNPNVYYWDQTNRLPMIARAEDWCFRVHRNFPNRSVVQVSFFDHEKKYVHRTYYNWGAGSFNTYVEFSLRYDDISLVVDPVCADCHNYCKQLCFKKLKIRR